MRDLLSSWLALNVAILGLITTLVVMALLPLFLVMP